MKEITYAFNLLELPVLTAFLKLDPADLPERPHQNFESTVHKSYMFFTIFMEMKPPMNTMVE